MAQDEKPVILFHCQEDALAAAIEAATRDGHFARLNEEAQAVLEDRRPRICPLCLYPAGDLRCKCWETSA